MSNSEYYIAYSEIDHEYLLLKNGHIYHEGSYGSMADVLTKLEAKHLRGSHANCESVMAMLAFAKRLGETSVELRQPVSILI